MVSAYINRLLPNKEYILVQSYRYFIFCCTVFSKYYYGDQTNQKNMRVSIPRRSWYGGGEVVVSNR
jgi:hypothetical protein